jgi:hypothetical protein
MSPLDKFEPEKAVHMKPNSTIERTSTRALRGSGPLISTRWASHGHIKAWKVPRFSLLQYEWPHADL